MLWSKGINKDVKEKVRDKINRVLELPVEVMGNKLRVNIVDNSYVLIEGNCKVADYFDNYIKIKTDGYTLAVDGENLSIKEISDTDLIISGKIMNLSYI